MARPKVEAIVIGASAGGLEALMHLLPKLPAEYPFPVIIVVHVPPDAKSLLPELFAQRCAMRVKEAEDKESIQGGTIYFAPPNYHLLVESDRLLSLSSDEPELFSRPSVNVLFESAAEAYGDGLVGIILTGASNDGAHGLKCVHEEGGLALAQNPDSAEVAAMPRAALEACPAARKLTLDEISTLLKQLPKGIS